jgi:hypothetical protein
MDYIISQTEIARRKRAYLTLSVSIIFGLIIASEILNFPITPFGYLQVLNLILLLGIVSLLFFRQLSPTKIHLTGLILEKNIGSISEKYNLDQISIVKIKWTTNQTIREIYINFADGNNICITALAHFEKFRIDLLEKLNHSVIVKEIHELLNFDHPLFYSLLGIPISTAGVLIMKSIIYLNDRQIIFGIIVFIIYLISLGIYFILAKPISSRLGSKNVVSDYITGFILICTGLVIAGGGIYLR